MSRSIKLSPSILSADFMDFGHEIEMLGRAGADWVHIDVMDGHFVPNTTMGVPLVKQIKQHCDLVLDVHLMVSNPLEQIPWFLDAGADIVTFHIEAVEDLQEAKRGIAMIKGDGALASISIKPGTDVSQIDELLEDVDMVLVMSVEPGFSGQSYIEGTEDKIKEISGLCAQRGIDPIIEVDGGIGPATLDRVVRAGATALVCGNAVFKASDPEEAVSAIKEQAEAALRSCEDQGEI